MKILSQTGVFVFLLGFSFINVGLHFPSYFDFEKSKTKQKAAKLDKMS